MTRYQKAVLEALIAAQAQNAGHAVTARQVAGELVGSQTASSVRRILNILAKSGYANWTWGDPAKVYWATSRGRVEVAS